MLLKGKDSARPQVELGGGGGGAVVRGGFWMGEGCGGEIKTVGGAGSG